MIDNNISLTDHSELPVCLTIIEGPVARAVGFRKIRLVLLPLDSPSLMLIILRK